MRARAAATAIGRQHSRRAFLRSVLEASGAWLLGPISVASAAQSESNITRAPVSAFIRIRPDNRTTIIIPSSEMGQGVSTSLAMIVADEMDLDWALVDVEQALNGPAYVNSYEEAQATGGSTSVMAFGKPLAAVAAAARETLLASAAARWKLDAGELTTESSRVVHRASDRSLTYGELATEASARPVPTAPRLKVPAAGVSAAIGRTHRIRTSLRSAQRRALGFHHRSKHRFAGIDAQPEEGAVHIAQNAGNRQRQLNVNILGELRRSNRLRARLHFGGSFLCFGERLHDHMQAKGAATLTSFVQQTPGHRRCRNACRLQRCRCPWGHYVSFRASWVRRRNVDSWPDWETHPLTQGHCLARADRSAIASTGGQKFTAPAAAFMRCASAHAPTVDISILLRI
jgi:Molybdopterin cofactor-binding domain